MQHISPLLSLFMLIDKRKTPLTLLSTTFNRLRERIIIGALYIGNNATRDEDEDDGDDDDFDEDDDDEDDEYEDDDYDDDIVAGHEFTKYISCLLH